MREVGSGLYNVCWCKSWKAPISFVMPVCPHVRPSVRPHKTARLSQDKFLWNLVLGTFIKIHQEYLSLVTIVQKYRAFERKASLFLILLMATYVVQLYGKCICVPMAKLSLLVIFFAVTYVKQQYIRKVILLWSGNNASANLSQHYVPRTYYVPSYIYETKPEVWTMLIPILRVLLFTVWIHIHLSPTLRTRLPNIFPKQYFDLKIDAVPSVLPIIL